MALHTLADDASLTSRGRRGYAPTLTWYLASRLFVYLGVTLIVLATFAYLIDVLELLREIGGKNISSAVAMRMSLIKLPDIMMQMLPFAVLLATMVTLQQLNRSSELIALRAAGLPARRFLLGPLLVILATGLAALFIFNPVAATMIKHYDRWKVQTFPGSARGLMTAGGSVWLRQHERDFDFFIYGASIDQTATVIQKATVFAFDPQGDFRARMDARRMVLETLPDGKHRWRLEDLVTVGANHTVTNDGRAYLPTSLTPALLQNSFNQADTLSIWELRKFIGVLRESGFPSAAHEMTYQRLLALPALLLAMFWLGVPFTLRYVRQGGLGLAIGAGLGLGFGFFLFSNYVAAFGLAGRLNVTLAAWIPTLIAGLIATALLVQLREE